MLNFDNLLIDILLRSKYKSTSSDRSLQCKKPLEIEIAFIHTATTREDDTCTTIHRYPIFKHEILRNMQSLHISWYK